jgi:acylphosphatase
MNIRMLVTVRGKVQGVNYRYHTQQQAILRNVTGWVRNLPDGSVLGCFEGNERDVRALVDWFRSGPSWARVDAVLEEPGAFTGEFKDFRIRPD